MWDVTDVERTAWDTSADHRKLREQAAGRIPEIAEASGIQAVYRLDQQAKVLEILPHREYPPAARIRRNADGTLDAAVWRHNEELNLLDPVGQLIRHEICKWDEMWAYKLSELPGGEHVWSDRERKDQRLKRLIRESAETALMLPHHQLDPELPPTPWGLRRVEHELERIFMEELLDQDVLESARHVLYCGRPVRKLSPAQYNAHLRYASVIEEAEAHNPLIANLWWHHMVRLDPPVPGNLEDMSRMTRERLEMTPGEWDALGKIDPRLTRPEFLTRRQRSPQEDIRDITARTRMIAQAIPEDSCRTLTEEVWLMDWSGAERQDEHVQTWVECVRGAMAQHREEPGECISGTWQEEIPLEPESRKELKMEATWECEEVGDLLNLVGEYLNELSNSGYETDHRNWEEVREAALRWKEEHKPDLCDDEEYSEREARRNAPFWKADSDRDLWDRMRRFAQEEMPVSEPEEDDEEQYNRVEAAGGCWQEFPGAGWVFRSQVYLAAGTLMHELRAAEDLARIMTMRDLHFSALTNGIRPGPRAY